MHVIHSSFAAILLGGACSNPSSAQQLPTLDPLHVSSIRSDRSGFVIEHSVGPEHQRSADTAAMVGKLPGAAIVRNGAQTGILQLRGLSGDRVAVRVDGMAITPACPNHMDPPLHYAHPSSGDLIELMAGISPVSVGGDHIGGALLVKRADPEFAGTEALLTQGALGTSFLGSQEAMRLHGDLSIATASRATEYRGAAATADDLRFPGGTVSASGYETTRHSLRQAWRTDGGFIAVDAGFSATRDAGTPSLPMDMVSDDAWRFGLSQKESFAWGTLEHRVAVHDIEHLMDNFSLRPLAPGAMAMESPASSRDFAWRGDAVLPLGDHSLLAGIDLHHNGFDAEQVVTVGMMSGLRRDTFEDNRRRRQGLYAEWRQEHSERWSSRIGARGDVVSSDAGRVDNAILPPPGPMRDAILADQAAFNAADRSVTEVLPALTAALRFEPDRATVVELAAALKSRAPSLVERYLWTPLNASAGLADGRSYLGNLDLDPETSLQLALGITRSGESWTAGVTPFYQSINDYIQGMPLARNDSNGLPVLQYGNIDRAELYGMELRGGWQMGDEFTLEGSVSHVRGRNRETGDDLYRIAPLRGMFDLGCRRGSWESHFEWVWAAAQNRVSSVQNESASPGYGILNLRVARTFGASMRVEVGMENLLDKRYADHLGGVNRVSGGDLGVGEAVPAAGRFAYVSLGWGF